MAFTLISLEELIKKNVTHQTYKITEKKHPSGEVYEVSIIATAVDGNRKYAAEKDISIYQRNEKLVLDKDGLPYYEGHIGNVPYRRHDDIFWGNRSFASSMGQLHQNAVFNVLGNFRKNNHPAYKAFLDSVGEVIAKLAGIKDAYDIAYYEEDKSMLQQFSEWEKKAFRYLTTTSGYSWDGYKPANHSLKKISLAHKQHVDGISGSTKEEALFLHWYSEYLKKNNYPYGNDYAPLYSVLAALVGQVQGELKQAGFIEKA